MGRVGVSGASPWLVQATFVLCLPAGFRLYYLNATVLLGSQSAWNVTLAPTST